MSRYIPTTLRRDIREHFDNCCAYCRSAEALTIVTFEIEHIVPYSAGGPSLFGNLCLACPSCNRYKSTHQQAIDPESQEQVRLFHPQQDVWGQNFFWLEDGSVLEGRTPTGRATIAALKMNRPQLVRLRRLWIKLGKHPPEHLK